MLKEGSYHSTVEYEFRNVPVSKAAFFHLALPFLPFCFLLLPLLLCLPAPVSFDRLKTKDAGESLENEIAALKEKGEL